MEGMKITTEKGRASFDVAAFVEAMDDETRNEVARHIVSDQAVLETVAEAAANGCHFVEMSNPLHDERGYWSIGGVDKLRQKLIELMPEIARETVRDLLRKLDRAKASARNETENYWALYHSLPNGFRPPERTPGGPMQSYSQIDKTADYLLGDWKKA